MTDHMIFTICSAVVFYTSSNKAVSIGSSHSHKEEFTVERKTEIMTSYIVGAQKS